MISLAHLARRSLQSIATFAVALAFMVSAPLVAFATPTLLQLSSDPFTDTASQHRTEVEPDSLSAGSTLVSAFQVGRIFGGGSADIGFATSTNGGNSFTSGFLPSTTTAATPPGMYSAVSDASVAYDARDGIWLISYLGISPNGSGSVDVLVSRSIDGGLTWSAPVVVNKSGHFNDKNWTVCDDTAASPFYGHCYTEFDDNTRHDLIQMSTSTDGGRTWGAAQTTQNQTHGIGGQPLVQPSGTVVVPIVGFGGNKFLMLSFVSTDGGASWGKTAQITSVAFHTPSGGIRADIPLPSAEIDGAGTVYVVWPDCRFEAGCAANDLVFTSSSDGANWSSITRIPLDAIGSGVDHFIPGLAVDRSTSGSSANLAVTFYYYPDATCTAATCQLDTGYSTSTDGGATWTSKTQIAGPLSLSWIANTSQGRMVGDYISTSFVGGSAYPDMAEASANNGATFNEAMFTLRGGERVAGPGHTASDRVNAGGNDTQGQSDITTQ